MERDWGSWDVNWALSVGMIALTIAVHAFGIVALARVSEQFWNAPFRKAFPISRNLLAISVIAGIGVCLAMLHGIEAMLWALIYLHVDGLNSPAHAVLYSLDSMTTRGASGLALQPRWRMMGAAEAMDGMLLFGISTAFLFAVLQNLLISPSELVRQRVRVETEIARQNPGVNSLKPAIPSETPRA
jgi:hypothetical protein